MSTTEYLVPEHVRVRREDFGLLFYDARSTKLTFVRCGDRLEPPPFTGARRVLRRTGAGLAADDGAGRPLTTVDPALDRVLQDLVKKGLLVAIPGE